MSDEDTETMRGAAAAAALCVGEKKEDEEEEAIARWRNCVSKRNGRPVETERKESRARAVEGWRRGLVGQKRSGLSKLCVQTGDNRQGGGVRWRATPSACFLYRPQPYPVVSRSAWTRARTRTRTRTTPRRRVEEQHKGRPDRVGWRSREETAPATAAQTSERGKDRG